MHCSFHLALCALPLIYAAPLDLTGGLGDVGESVSGRVENLTDQPLGAVLPIDQIVKNPENIVDNVNAVLGNILPDRVDSKAQYEEVLNNIHRQLTETREISATFAGLFQAIVQSYTPQSIPEALQQLEKLFGNGSTGVTLENVGLALLNGLSTADLTQNVLSGYLSDINSYNNTNPPIHHSIYPRASPTDAPYTVPESSLRSALYIPSTFTHGRKRPILFVPGTGAFGGVNFASNLGKLLSPDYDITYLNIPGAMYNDIQINAEYIAYATQYLSTLTSRSDLAIIGWSQGNLATQWTLQYWPSTRPLVEDFISVSADFHGTTLAYFLSPTLPTGNLIPNPPSILQQQYDSTFIRTLRSGGGGSPYVPSTSIWSITDEIVQPQYEPFASAAYLTRDLPGSEGPGTCPGSTVAAHSGPDGEEKGNEDTDGGDVPVPAYTNNQIQRICRGQPAGGFYPHEGVLYNPLTHALILDALQHPGPGQISRLTNQNTLPTICAQVIAPGLTLADVLATEGLIPLAAINLLLYPGKVLEEPKLRGYAVVGAGDTC